MTETLHIQRNRLSGSVDEFMCANLPSDFELDCEGEIPDVMCTCCIGCVSKHIFSSKFEAFIIRNWCDVPSAHEFLQTCSKIAQTIVSDDECNPEGEELVFIHVEAGDATNNFAWELFDYNKWNSPLLIAAGGLYENGEVFDIQLCLASPGHYYAQTTGNNFDGRESLIRITSQGQNISLGVSDYEYFFISDGDDTYFQEQFTNYPSPTPAPSFILQLITYMPTMGSTTFATPTVGTDKTLPPTFTVARPVIPTTPPNVQPPIQFPAPPPVSPPISPPVTYVDSNCISLDITLVTDAFGDETSFSIIDKNRGIAVLSSGNSYDSNSTYTLNECLNRSGCYDFVIEDQWDDGMCCKGGNGSYTVSILDRTIGNGGKFGSSETIFIGGSCGKYPSSDTGCNGSMKLLNVTVRTDNWGEETSWEVYDASSGAVYALSDVLFGNNTTYTEVICIPGNKCYTFVIYDSVGDGLEDGLPFFHVGYDGNAVITSGGNFGESFAVSFGSDCNEGNI